MSATRGLYFVESTGRYVRTQSQIPKGDPVEKVEVPVGSQELCDFLNNLLDGNCHDDTIVDDGEEPITVKQEAPPPPTPAPPTAPATMTLTDVEEFIQNADAPRLASITQNACFRMDELIRGLS